MAAFSLTTALLTVAGYIIVYCLYRTLTVPSGLKGIPSPPTWPFIGHLHEMRQGSTALLLRAIEWSSKWNKFFVVWFGPWWGQVFCVHPDTVKLVLKQNTPKNMFYNFLHPWLGTGLLTSMNPKWRIRRRMITPSFHFEILKSYGELFTQHAQVLIEYWGKSADSGAEVEVFSDVTHCTLDIIAQAAMGVKLDSVQQPNTQYVSDIYEASELVFYRFLNPLYWYDTLYYMLPAGRRFKKAVAGMHAFTNAVIQKRRHLLTAGLSASRDGRKKDFLDMLLEARDETGEGLDDQSIQEEVDTFMFEGHDTTSAGLAWSIYCISRHPEVQAKLHEELDRVLGKRKVPDYDDLPQLTYVAACAKEAQRLYPSVPVLGRVLTDDLEMEGHVIPKGTNINVVSWALHRNPTVWKDPEAFKPERFLEGNRDDMDAYAHVPFSAGPRNCVGQKFAYAEVHTILGAVFKTFEVTFSPGQTVTPVPEIILRPVPGVNVTLKRR